MTHIFNERMKIDHVDEDEIPINVSLPSTDGLTENELMQDILIELQKITLHLSLMTGELIKETDI